MTNEERFVNELIGYIFAYPDDDYMTMECLCRKLHKHGLIDKKDGYYLVADDTLRKTEQTEPTTEDCSMVEENCDTCEHKDNCEGATYEYKNTQWWCLGYKPKTDCPWK